MRKKGFEVKKKNGLSLAVKIGNQDTHKYHSLVIDCLDGHIYGVNKDNNEKKIGKLLSFQGTRASDAFHCMKKSIEKIVKKVDFYSLLNEVEELEKNI
ncbi:hypothetical protein D3C81_1034600 [compost metagenome]